MPAPKRVKLLFDPSTPPSEIVAALLALRAEQAARAAAAPQGTEEGFEVRLHRPQPPEGPAQGGEAAPAGPGLRSPPAPRPRG